MVNTLDLPSEVEQSAVLAPRYVNVIDVSAASAFVVPVGIDWVMITSTPETAGFWMKVGGTAVIGTGAVSDGTGSFYVPSTIECKVEQGTSISFIAHAEAGYVTIACYSD